MQYNFLDWGLIREGGLFEGGGLIDHFRYLYFKQHGIAVNLEVHEYLRKYDSKLIHTKHDAVYFKIAEEEKYLIDELKEILEKDTLIGDVLMDVKIGRNWGEC